MVSPIESPRSGLFRASEGHLLHEIACEFTRIQYKKRFSCDLAEFYPNTFSVYDEGNLIAVAGYRGAGTGPLFLEQYLDKPIEDCIWAKFTPPAQRAEIVELGGFAAISRKAALPLMLHLAPALDELGFKKLVCTANKPIQKCLAKLGLDPIFIADAISSRIQASKTNWGTYYQSHPEVFAGDIKAGMQALAKQSSEIQ